MRGEYRRASSRILFKAELPPRARRIPAHQAGTTAQYRTTSACAENTSRIDDGGQPIWNYLRVRGEYIQLKAALDAQQELPPRARRIQRRPGTGWTARGTTSACAENTTNTCTQVRHHRNYLRVRGEYVSSRSPSLFMRELPPRARRILRLKKSLNKQAGTTSACAENTRFRMRRQSYNRNYLRVRGEYISIRNGAATLMELPPRARRILFNDDHAYHCLGTTSACAENTEV